MAPCGDGVEPWPLAVQLDRLNLNAANMKSEGLQLFPRLEAHCLAGRNHHLFAGARVPSDAGLSGSHVEDAKAAKLDAFTPSKRRLQRLKHSFDGLLRFCARNAGATHYRIDDVQLDHSCLRSLRLHPRGRCHFAFASVTKQTLMLDIPMRVVKLVAVY